MQVLPIPNLSLFILYLQKVDDDASVHDQVLWAIHMSGFDDLIKFLASAQSEQQWSMHVLEIISLMFRDQVRQKDPFWECTSKCSSCSLFQWVLLFLLLLFSFFTDSRSFGECRPCSFSRREEEGF